MKTLLNSILIVLCFTISACGPSAEQLAATAVVAQAQTETAAPTKTPTPTATYTLTPEPTATLTASPTPQTNLIISVIPENPDTYSVAGYFSLPTTEDQFNLMSEKDQNSDPVSICPEVWIAAVPDEPNPLYALFVNASPDDKEKAIMTAIHPTIPEVDSFVVGLGIIPPDANGKFIMAIDYQSNDGQPNPDELEILVIVPGCEVYKESVTWP